MSNINNIGSVTVEVKAGLSIDEHTFRTCLDLIAIRARNEGKKGLVITIPGEDECGCGCTAIPTEKALNRVFDALYDIEGEKRL